MEANQLRSSIVTSINKFGGRQMQKVFLQFIPASIYAYAVGHNTITQRQNELYASQPADEARFSL